MTDFLRLRILLVLVLQLDFAESFWWSTRSEDGRERMSYYSWRRPKPSEAYRNSEPELTDTTQGWIPMTYKENSDRPKRTRDDSGATMTFAEFQHMREMERQKRKSEADTFYNEPKEPVRIPEPQKSPHSHNEVYVWHKRSPKLTDAASSIPSDMPRENVEAMANFLNPESQTVQNRQGESLSEASDDSNAEGRETGSRKQEAERSQQEQEHQTELRKGEEVVDTSHAKATNTIVPYNVIAGFVSVIWLINILFIAWIVFGRESNNNMRIPSSFEYKTPINTVGHKNIQTIYEKPSEEVKCERQASVPTVAPVFVPLPPAQLPPPELLASQPVPLQAGHSAPKFNDQEVTNQACFNPVLRPPLQGVEPANVQSLYGGRDPEQTSHNHSFCKLFKPMIKQHLPLKERSTPRFTPSLDPISEHSSITKDGVPKLNLTKGIGRLSLYRDGTLKLGNGSDQGKNRDTFGFWESRHNTNHTQELESKIKRRPQANGLKDPSEKNAERSSRADKFKRRTAKESNNSCNRSALSSSRDRTKDGKATDLKSPSSSPMGITVYDIKDFVSLPEEVLEILTCDKPGNCQHDHSKYRMVGEKLYILSSCPPQSDNVVVSSADTTHVHDSFNTEQVEMNVVNKKSVGTLEKNQSKSIACGGDERLLTPQKDNTLSTIQHDASTQISNPRSQHTDTGKKTTATVTSTTQCPSTFAISTADVHRDYLPFEAAVQNDGHRKREASRGKARKTKSSCTRLAKVSMQKEISEKLSHLCDDMTTTDSMDKGDTCVTKMPFSLKRGSESKTIAPVYQAVLNSSLTESYEGFQHVTDATSKRRRAKSCDVPKHLAAPKSEIFQENNTTLMAPPPFGYHVRLDDSSTGSVTETNERIRIVHAGNDQDVIDNSKSRGNRRLTEMKTSDAHRIGVVKVDPFCLRNMNTMRMKSGDQSKYLLLHRGSRNKVSLEGKKRPKKLMIIGKLNYFKRNNQQCSEGDESATCPYESQQSGNGRQKKMKYKFGRRYTQHNGGKNSVWFKQAARNIQSYDRIRVQTPSDSVRFSVSQDSPLYYYKSSGHSKQDAKKYQYSNDVHCQGLGKQNIMRNFNHNAVEKNFQTAEGFVSLNASVVKKACHLCLNIRSLIEKRFGSRAHLPKRASSRHCSKFLPSYYLNVNTNAGAMDTNPEGLNVSGPATKRTSTTSVHSVDQYYSTQTDTPDWKNVDTDPELSPCMSFTEDTEMAAAEKQQQEAKPKDNKLCDQVQNLVDGWEVKKQNIMQACNAAINSRLQRRNMQEYTSDDYMDVGDRQASKTAASATNAQKERSTSPSSPKHSKKRAKKTEAVYIKFESSLSKKVTTTAVLKDRGKKIYPNKSKSDQDKMLPWNDAQEGCSGEKNERKVPTTEIPRYTKIVKCFDKNHDMVDVNGRRKQQSDTSLHSIYSKDGLMEFRSLPGQDHASSTGHSQALNNILVKTVPDTTGKGEDVAPSKNLVTVKEFHPQESPESVSNKVTKTDSSDCDRIIDKQSSVTTVVHLIPAASNDPRGMQSEDDEIVINTLVESANESREEDNVPVETNKRQKPTSGPSHKSPSRKTHKAKRKGSGARKKSPSDPASKHSAKTKKTVKAKSKTSDDVSVSEAKETVSESSKGGPSHRSASTTKRRSPEIRRSLSGSPEMKRKRRVSRKKEPPVEVKGLHVVKEPKPENGNSQGKQKKGTKSVPKRKTNKTVASSGDGGESQGESECEGRASRSRSPSSDRHTLKAPKTLLGSVSPSPELVYEDDTEMSPHSAREDSSIVDTIARLPSPKHEKSRKRAAASEERAAANSETDMLSGEAVPTFTGTVYRAPTKVVQIASKDKSKKGEKDLQQAEMGWNSSFLSDAKAAEKEKNRRLQKRNAMRYYLVKPKQKRPSGENGSSGSKLKRTSKKPNWAEGDSSGAGKDAEEAGQRERNGTAPGKSVQFSDSIEELEASGNETARDSSASPDRQDSSLTFQSSVLASAAAESKAQTKSIRLDGQYGKADAHGKKESGTPHNTPPRRKRPVWLKKNNASSNVDPKDKAGPLTKSSSVCKNAVSTSLSPMRKRHSSDNMMKSNSRGNLQAGQSKPTYGSPNLSNISLNDKRTVAYNSWINSVFLAAPLNKATKKVVAKVGSPVDIKEIIEGTSVDAADHFRAMRQLHDVHLRSTKSVSSVGSHKGSSTDAVGKKKGSRSAGHVAVHKKSSKELKLGECMSNRSLSPGACSDDTDTITTKSGLVESISPMYSAGPSNEDGSGGKAHGQNRLLTHGHPRRREKKPKPGPPQDVPTDWPVVASQSAPADQSLARVHYHSDMEFNILHMGISWMMQRFFNRINFPNPRPAVDSASGDMASNHPLPE